MTIDRDRLARRLAELRETLLAARTAGGWWVGELSASALSTAVAAFALATVDARAHAGAIARGLDWLAAHQNADGGWGDTVTSPSNLSTTVLCRAALTAGEAGREEAAGAAEAWLKREVGGLEPAALARAIADAYGADRSFSVPILAMCALAGRLGPAERAWRLVRQLPFELAACPHRWFRRLRLPVVSYALPALIAIGLLRHNHRPTRNPLARLLRNRLRGRALRVLADIQPADGGFLEAAPLTGFVAMSLAAAGLPDHPVALKAVRFLLDGARPDGSWPIDTNLATWVTTLSVEALGGRIDRPDAVRDWLFDRQYRTEHPYTHAAPGGWAWTDLPGGVPDADDTAGALLALRTLAPGDPRCLQAAAAGAAWLADLQNRDGGIPTFCRGWGRLPFDRSAADLTAHALRAWSAWRALLPADLRRRTDAAADRAIGFLYQAQSTSGAWAPLWFGSESLPGQVNWTYGTARVLTALAGCAGRAGVGGMIRRGLAWLVAAQAPDGGWGGGPGAPPGIEETALAVEALAAVAGNADASAETRGATSAAKRGRPAGRQADLPPGRASGRDPFALLPEALAAGANWLIDHTANPEALSAAPIGLYFARLWYYERLYPLIFAAAALRRIAVRPCSRR